MVAIIATLARMEPAASIISKFGGPSKVAALLGVHRTRVSTWKSPKGTGVIPQRYHLRLLDEAKRSGVPLTANDLLPRPLFPSNDGASA
jgi:hypothetical protein